MLRIVSQVLLLVGVLFAAAGLVIERRAGRWQISTPAFVLLLTALLLAAAGIVLAWIGA